MRTRRFQIVKLVIFYFIIASGVLLAQGAKNLISNPEFDKGKNGWILKTLGGATASLEATNTGTLSGANAMIIHCPSGGGGMDDIQFYQSKTLQQGADYSMGFLAISDVPHRIQVGIEEPFGRKHTVWVSDTLTLNSTPVRFGPFTFHDMLPGGAYKFKFMLGGLDNVNVTIDSVWMTVAVDSGFRSEDDYAKRLHPYQDLMLPYRWFVPANQETSSKRYPLVLALHGVGECGTDNEKSLSPQHRLAFTWSDSVNQAQWPCFVLVPQCPNGSQWVDVPWVKGSYRLDTTPISKPLAAVVDLLDSLVMAFPIDTTRIYVTGLSMGGFGTFDLIMRYPNRFAAAVPMSGAGDPTQAGNLFKVPIWDFHGDADTTVPVSGSRDMMTAFKDAGRTAVNTHCFMGVCEADPNVVMDAAVAGDATLLYTEYKGGGHVIWAESYEIPQLHDWLFSQSLDKRTGIASKEPIASAADFSLSQNYPNPFNPSTRILYTLAGKSKVSIEIFDAEGRRVTVLADGTQEAGSHTAVFDAAGRPSGIYFVRLAVNGQLRMKRMVLVK